MLEEGPTSMDKLALPNSQSPEKSTQENSQRKIDDEGSKWKSKSLNSLPTQHYQMDLTKTLKVKAPTTTKQPKGSKKPAQQQKDKKSGQGGQKLLPQPKIKKINQKMFCITIDNQIYVFYLMEQRQKARLKTKRSFNYVKYENISNIQFACGNGSNLIFLGSENQLVVLEMEKKQNQFVIIEKTRKTASQLRAVTFIGQQMILVTSDQLFQYSLTGNFDLIAKKAIQFEKQSDKKLFNQLKPINLVVESIFCFYFFGTKVQQKIDYNSKRKFNMDAPPPSKLCQILHIVKFKIQHNLDNVQMTKGQTQTSVGDQQLKKTRYMSQTQIAQSKISSIQLQIYPIDHVFETGIFDKSKIYELDENIFLMSLHEQIILIKKHFKKFIVWDNVSIVSSKSQEKKGQLVLADKRIVVYSQNGEIFAHDIFFNEQEARINMPPIDSFRGNDNDEEMLYDAVLLQYDKQSLMKVLFYFKQVDVILPNKGKFRKQADNPNDPQHDQNALHFTMLCINQSDPQEKLKQMLRLKKPPNQIAQFCQRFNIKPLQKTKCMWSVSDKSLKDIENVLLQISDDGYIQMELDNILKKEPHGLTFLITVQKKQIARLKKLIVRNLLNDSGTSQVQIISIGTNPEQTEKKRRDYVKRVIQWLMESIMFEKKLEYSKNFLSFKEYDFIQIGKLKAASLKEEIKLLSCKKYQKRLKYFLNSFKVLAIANWEQIFQFLLQNKNEAQINQFLVDFSFILPRFVETSVVFQKRKNFSLYSDPSKKTEIVIAKSKPTREARVEKVSSEDEKCYLWDDLTEIHNIIEETLKAVGQEKVIAQPTTTPEQAEQQLNTVQDFQSMIVENIKALKKEVRTEGEAINNFMDLLQQVVDSDWFKVAAFKQHSMLNKKSIQLQEEFLQLKNKKAYQILVKYLFRQIEEGNPDITVAGVDSMLSSFITCEKLRIPQSFKRNHDARLEVYTILQKQKFMSKSSFSMKKFEYLVMNEDVYFNMLFNQIRSQILKNVKAIYDGIEQGFFRERFEIFLKSRLVDLKTIIKFVDQFENANADDVRLDVFNCIKRLLRLNDYENTRNFIDKSLQKQVLPEGTNEMDRSSYQMNLRDEAKIPYGFVFYSFFKAFNLQYTYEQLIQSTKTSNLPSNKFLQQLIHKYCGSLFYTDTGFQGNRQCLIEFQDNKIVNQKLASVDIFNRPLQFFGVLLYLVDILDFQVQEKDLYELIIQNYLNEGKINQQKMVNEGRSSKSPLFNNKIPNTASNGYDSKFQQLWSFVKSIDNYIMTGEDLNTKNYLMINNFKDEHDAQQIFVDYTIEWISRNYSAIKSKEQIEPTLLAIKKVLQILQKSNKSAKRIKQVDAFYRLLQFLKKFNPEIMMKIDYIKEQLEYHSGFIFLIHMFRQIGVDNFISADLEQQINKKVQNENQEEPQLMMPKKAQTSVQTTNKVYNWMCIFSQYKIIKGQQHIDAKDSPQFIRFLIEICCIMISEQKYEIAWDLLLRAVNQAYYFRDSFYYLASEMRIDNKSEFKESFRVFLSTETAKNLKSKLNAMVKGVIEQSGSGGGKVLSFPPQRLTGSTQSRQKRQISELKQKNSLFIFQQLLESNRADQAFFFLVRIKRIQNLQIQQICVKAKRLSSLGLYSYLLLTAYMKSLQKYISNQFYPTFLFFKSKYEILIDNVQRKDIIKDINIAVSRLKSRWQEEQIESLKKDVAQCRQELNKYYLKYMQIIQEDPVIKLTQEDQEQATKRIQMYARITPQILQDQSKQQSVAKLRLQQNQQKLHKVHENNKLNVIHKEIQQSVTQAKRTADKYQAILQEKKKQASRMTYAQKKQQQLLQIKRKQQDQVSSIKDSFKSGTTQKVNELIQTLRKKRQMINESRYKSSMIRQQDDRHDLNVPSKDVPMKKQQKPKQLPQSKYNIQVTNTQGNRPNLLQNPQSYGIGNRASQIIQNAKRSYIQGESKPSQKFLEIQQKMKKLEQPTISKSKVSIDEISQLFRAKQPEATKYLQKFDLIKQNMQVGVELVKRVYSVVKDLSNFLQFMRYLFGIDDRYKEVLQEKSIPVVGQMIKMDQKINLKQLIPVELFTSVQTGMSIKDYYNSAYETIKPSLKKILAQQKIAAHALGILMRYSLGSETKYFHRVFADYINVLLKTYQTKVYDEKQTFLLAQKLRSQFTNLQAESREFIFEKLVNEVTNQAKRKKLIEGLKKAIQRKTDSALGGGQNEQIARALMRLQKKTP